MTTQPPEALPALIERLRLLPIDHAPDGWPAVRTREITALLDRITELEAQLAAIGAGGVEPLRKRPRQIEHDHFRDATKMVIAQSAPAAVAVPSEFPHEQMDAMALARYKVVLSTSSMIWSHAVVAGDGAQQLYVGREVECQNMVRKFAGAFLDGAFAFHSIAAAPTAHAAPPQEAQEPVAWQGVHDQTDLYYAKPLQADVRPLYAAPQPAPVAQGDAEDAARYRWIAAHCRSTSEHWGGRWSIIVDGPAPKSHDSEDDFDEAVDAARKQGGKP